MSGFWQRLRRWTYPKAARVVALTSGTAAWIETHVPGSRLAVIPNPVHWPLPQAEPRKQPEPRPGRRRLLAVGRLHQDKGFDLLIQAFKQLASAHPDWDLVILGEGGERAALEAQLRQSGMQDRVWMPGRVGNVGDWYASADLYVLTSRFEACRIRCSNPWPAAWPPFVSIAIQGRARSCAMASMACWCGPTATCLRCARRWTRSWAMTRCVRAWRPPRPMCATVFGQPGVGTLGRTFDGVTRAGR